MQSFEPIFHQDLNGDGQIGPATTVIEANGSTRLTEVGDHFFLYDSSGSGPSLKYGGMDAVAGQFGAWAPIGAEQTASGYEVAWKLAGADHVHGLEHRQQRQLHHKSHWRCVGNDQCVAIVRVQFSTKT